MRRALLIGDAERDEMRPIARWLEQRVTEVALQREGTIFGRLSASDPGDLDLIVVLESHPDEYSVGDVHALFAAAPLARIVCCAGGWSESAGRTRTVWPLAVRVPVVHAVARLEREWALLNDGRRASYLPATGSREEWFAAHHPPLWEGRVARGHRGTGSQPAEDGPCPPGFIRIISPDPAYRQMLTDVCTLSGFSVTDDPNAVAAVVLFDVDPWNLERAVELKRFCNSAPIIALTDWPLPELVAALEAAGAKCTLPKLGDLNRLIQAIHSFRATTCPQVVSS